jgi:hypothetical protein
VRRFSSIALVLACLGCAANRNQVSTRDRALQGASDPDHAAGPTGTGLPSTRLAELSQGAFGPYLAESGGSRLVAWAAPQEADGYFWQTLALGPGGKPLGEALQIGAAPASLGLVALRAAGGGGYVLLWTDREDDREVLTVARLGRGGELTGAPVEVGTASGSVMWVEAVALQDATVLLWAEPGDGEARLEARVLDAAGRLQGDSFSVLEGALAWQAARVPEGAAVVAVQRAAAEGARGRVVVRYLGRDGAPAATPVVISEGASAQPDVDAAAVPGGLLVAWTDVRDGDPAVFLAGLDQAGVLVASPARATRGLGAEAFVRVLAPAAGRGTGYLVWEGLGERPDSGRSLRVAPVDAQWKLGEPQASVAVASSNELPELVATERGVHALTLAPPCPPAGACQEVPGPFFVQLDGKLTPRVAEPLLLAAAPGHLATSAWNLSCTATDCVALAAADGAPTPVYAVELGDVAGEWRSPAARLAPPRPPFPVSLRVVERTVPLSDVAMAQVADETLVTWLTYFDPTAPYERPSKPAPDGRFAPVRAQLWVSRLQDDGLATPTNISYRARSLGGVALSPSTDGDEALLAWSALDQNRPQVFLTLLGSRGQREAQKMFTRSAGEVSDVALARVSDGWIVGWVDERHDDPEVYVAKVDRALLRQGSEQRVTEAKGVATGLQLIASGDDEVLAVWADARDDTKQGWADIYSARVAAKDAKPLGAPQRLASSRGHSHSPALARLGDSVVVAWLDGPGEGGKPAAGVSIARLDAQARFRSPPARAKTDGVPTSLALECRTGRCRIVTSLDAGSQSALAALTWKPSEPGSFRRLRALPGASGQPVPAVLFGGRLLYADQPASDAGRLNLMGIEW